MSAVWHLAGTLAIGTGAAGHLVTARWVWRAPRTGILLWQLLALSWVLSAIGALAAFGVSPYGRDIPSAFQRWLHAEARPAGFTALHAAALAAGFAVTGALVLALAVSWVRVLQVRRRHRRVLAMVARRDPSAPGAVILDHPLPVAYCLPGLRSKVVVSSGALQLLTAEQVTAVLAHEHAHARERHDLVLLPFTALRRLVPRNQLVTRVAQAVGLLVEMRADDRACRNQCPRALATALHRFSTVPAQPIPGTLGVADAAIQARLQRISRPPAPLPGSVQCLVLTAGVVLLATPVSFLAF